MNYINSSLHVDNFDDLLKYKDLIVSGDILIERSEEMNKEYHKYRMGMKENYQDYGEHIRVDVMNNKPYCITEDKFPRDVPDDTEEHILWIDQKEISEEYFQEILSKVMLEYGWKKEDMIIFEKDPQNRSVPEVRHWHIFLRKH